MSSKFRVLCAKLPKPGHPEKLSDSEGDHLVRVLRLRDGDAIEALDGNGHSARVTLRTKGGQGPHIEFLSETQNVSTAGATLPIILEMAILKGEAMEWVVEKAVELGVHVLVPVITAHTVVQTKNKGPEAFRERWQKIADQALKQCGRLDRMQVEMPTSLDQLPPTTRLWCDEQQGGSVDLLAWLDQKRSQLGSIGELRLLIGPEGGWSVQEREFFQAQSDKTVRVSLGPAVLRAETAAIYATSVSAAVLRLMTPGALKA